MIYKRFNEIKNILKPILDTKYKSLDFIKDITKALEAKIKYVRILLEPYLCQEEIYDVKISFDDYDFCIVVSNVEGSYHLRIEDDFYYKGELYESKNLTPYIKKSTPSLGLELIDRLYLITDIYDNYIKSHPTYDLLPLKEREEMVKLLYEQYQKVGCALDKLENKDGEF